MIFLIKIILIIFLIFFNQENVYCGKIIHYYYYFLMQCLCIPLKKQKVVTTNLNTTENLKKLLPETLNRGMPLIM